MIELIVANNMVMEAETAHVLQTCHMLEAFSQVTPAVRYLWPHFGKTVGILDRVPVLHKPLRCHFRYGNSRYLEFSLRLRSWLSARAKSSSSWRSESVLFTRNLGVAVAAQSKVAQVVLELHQGLSAPAARALLLLSKQVKIVAISGGLREHLIEQHKLAPERIIVAHDGVEAESFATAIPLANPPRPSRPGIITHLYYGAMRPERGLPLIRYAAEQLPEHSFVLVGGSPAEARAELELPNMRFEPALPHQEIPSLIKAFDTVLLPYTKAVSTHRWMSPLKLFEIMASGVPALVSSLPALTEIVGEDQVSFFDSEDPESLVAALRQIAADRESALAKAQKAQLRARTACSWEQRARSILDFALK